MRLKLFLTLLLLVTLGTAQTRTSATQEGNNAFSGTNTFTGTLKVKDPYLDIRAFGGSGDGLTDNVAALALAATTSANDTCKPIYFPAGTYIFSSRPAAIPGCVGLVGASFSTTRLIANYNEATDTTGFLTWNGTAGTGSGGNTTVQDLWISKGGTSTGGTAIKLIAQDCSTRPVWMTFERIVVNYTYGASSGWWHHQFIADGSACTTSGTQGVRDVIISNSYFAGAKASAAASFTGYGLVFYNCVHCFLNNVLVFAAAGGDTTTSVLVSGAGSGTSASNNWYAANTEILGDLAFDQVSNAVFSGSTAGTFSSTVNSSGTHYFGYMAAAPTNNGSTNIVSNQWTKLTAPGAVGPSSALANIAFRVSGTSLSGATQRGVTSEAAFTSSATSNMASFLSSPSTANASFTTTDFYHYYASNVSKGGSHTITNQYGHVCAALSGATNNYCFYQFGTEANLLGGSLQVNNGLKLGSSGSTISDSRTLAQYRATLTTTAAASDNVAITGVTASSKCSLTATNSTAAADVASTYISAKTTDQITVTHPSSSGRTWDILCTNN